MFKLMSNAGGWGLLYTAPGASAALRAFVPPDGLQGARAWYTDGRFVVERLALLPAERPQVVLLVCEGAPPIDLAVRLRERAGAELRSVLGQGERAEVAAAIARIEAYCDDLVEALKAWPTPAAAVVPARWPVAIAAAVLGGLIGAGAAWWAAPRPVPGPVPGPAPVPAVAVVEPAAVAAVLSGDAAWVQKVVAALAQDPALVKRVAAALPSRPEMMGEPMP